MTRTHHSASVQAPVRVETLERRTMFAAAVATAEVVHDWLEVRGTNKSDEVVITANATDAAAVDVTVNGVALGTFTAAAGIDVRTGNGADAVTIDAAVTSKSVVLGGNGRDTLAGGSGDDSLDGGNGVDVLTGHLGNDNLFGGNGRDALDGGDGDDLLAGGRGRDGVTGGVGADTFQGDVLIEVLDLETTETITESLRGGGGKGKTR